MARRLLASVLCRRWMCEQRHRAFSVGTGSGNKLFVGGLSYRTDEEALRRAFSQHGEVVEVRLISDRETGRPKGFGFITFESEADAETARSKMTGQLLDGRVIRVDKATPSRPPLPSSGFSASSSSGGGNFASSVSSSLPPVAEDWGTIPTNVVDFGAAASPTPPTPPSTGFGIDTSKPFDSSTFGQAAASWPSYTPTSSSNANAPTTASPSTSSVVSNTVASASSFSSDTFGAASSFNSSTFGSAVNASTTSPTSPSASQGVTLASSSGASSYVEATMGSNSSSTFGAATNTSPSSAPVGHTLSGQPTTSGIATSSSFGGASSDPKAFDSSTFGSSSFNSNTATMTANISSVNTSTSSSVSSNVSTTAAGNMPPGSTPIVATSSAQPYPIGTTNSTSFGAATVSGKPFDSSTFGSASGRSNTSASVSFNTSSVSGITNTASVKTTTASIEDVPEATIIETRTSTISNTPGMVTSVPPPGAAIPSKPAESGAVAGSTSATSTAPSTPSAHPLNNPALTSSGTFDFSNFSFNNSSYRDNDPPLPRRRPRPRPRPASQSMTSDFSGSTASLLETRSPFGSNNQFAETSIPKPKGTEMDFGLLNITAPSPPGMRPQGVFDIDLPDDLPEIPPPEPKPKPKPMSLSMFPHRQLPAMDLPYHTPEADNWSDIGKDPPKYDLSTLFPSMGELLKKEKELHWDPYNFDPEFKLPPEEKVIINDSDYDEPWEKEDED